MKNIFIINPNAGKGETQKQLVVELKKRGIEYYETKYSGEGTEIAKRLAESGDPIRFFSCGGEGTNYEVINGIVGFPNASLGIVPCGSGNDFLKFFGNIEPFRDLDAQLEGKLCYVDLIKISAEGQTFYCINSCSAGMDAMVCENADKFKKIPGVSGKTAYMLGVVQTFFMPFGKKIDFTIDGKEYKDVPSLFAVCANAPFYGGGYKCAPSANPSDNTLNYSIISTRSRLKTVTILGKYRKGTHVDLPYCLSGECKTMTYSCNTPFTINIDGEVYHFKEVTCEIVENALALSVPESSLDSFGETVNFVEESINYI